MHVEQFRMLTCLDAVAIDADGQVAFEDNTLRTSIVGSSLQLRMKQVLDVVNEVWSQMDEGRCDKLGIGFKPISIISNKFLIARCFRCFITLFLEELLEVFELHATYGFVVAVR